MTLLLTLTQDELQLLQNFSVFSCF